MQIRPFQIAIIGLFASLAIFGLIFFSIFEGGSSETIKGYGDSVVVWGTLDERVFGKIITEIREDDNDFRVVNYRQIDARNYDLELLNAIAEGRSPDLVILPHDSLVKHRAKLLPLTYDTVPERDFRDTYVDGAEIFLLEDGVYGIPFVVDPLVMYWNRDIFSSSGLAAPPKTWEQLVSETTPAVTKTNSNLDVERSAVAFGEYSNITHAKDVLAMLFLQSGTSIVDTTDRGYQVALTRGDGTNEVRPADAALSFYTRFALPSGANYSWNRSLPNDRLQFLGGDLGIYFGYGSELAAIQGGNPNLNFDMAQVPQGASASTLRGYGTYYAFAIPKAAQNIQGAFRAANVFARESVSAQIAERLGFAPVHRGEIARGTSDPFRRVLYQSALITRGWLDPDPVASENVFKIMIEDVTSGRERVSRAISDAAGRLSNLF